MTGSAGAGSTAPVKSPLSNRLSVLRNKSPPDPQESELNHVPLPSSPSDGSHWGISKFGFALKKTDSSDTQSYSDHSDEKRSLMSIISRVRKLSRTSSDDSDYDPKPELKQEPKPEPKLDYQNDELFSAPLDKKTIPRELIDQGIEMLRVTHKKKIKRCFRLDLDTNHLRWNNKISSFLEIDKIKSIRTGDDARNYREEFKVSSDYKDLWITIIYYKDSKLNNIKALHMIAPGKHEYDTFVTTLSNLVYYKHQMESINGLFTNLHWNNKDSENEHLSFEGVRKLVSKLHVHVSTDNLNMLFNHADKQHKGYLNFDDFKEFVKSLRDRKELKQIFMQQARTVADKLTFEEFSNFLVEVQKESLTYSQAEHIFLRFSKSKTYLDFDEFANYLSSSYAAPYLQINETYTRPLNEYFISSSHNTYLLGKQVNGTASIEGYIRALQRGCRSIEIDLWDSIGGPVVTHGRTFSSSVDFQLVVETIRKYSFITSPYPVIISLEVRCSIENQLLAARILKDVLQDQLLMYPVDSPNDVLPSPEQLKHKVLLKVKKITQSSSTVDSMSSSLSSFSEDGSSISKIVPKKKKTVNLSPELGDLAIYVIGAKFRNFSLPESKTFNHCFSFSDKALIKMSKEETKLAAIFKHNAKFLMRIYPSIYRFSSNNFNPIFFWELGCQLVATNWQIYDLGQQFNETLFNVGSNSGYVLKPSCLRVKNPKIQNKEQLACLEFNRLKYLSVDLISCQQLPKPKDIKCETFDAFLELEVYSGDVIEAQMTSLSKSQGTYTLPDRSSSRRSLIDHLFESNEPSAVFKSPLEIQNGFNPIWNQKCSLKYLTNEVDFVFLRFLVKCNHENSEKLIGTHTCKLEYLKQGYRHLPLYDLQGEEFIYSTLFIKVSHGEA
ncbi:hypothetical protein OGAPHI_007386 [Ogataea philodendri]|uniref:Phosphoinositide phospholipase C n=1 Tax=Ogataea philodendri TaxID=1378263 RepID=A0A9P8SZ96_9ASCO|nr:uncharacterized protein OGAPHI_007386 [Ogataea philodendri]KAH3660181.1 hypothetical protein OGAPHI_007386 [Ogataea philodendri]